MEKAPHAVVIGSTGTGKTFLVQEILAKIKIYNADSSIYILDFKGDDALTEYSSCKNFYRYNECYNGLKEIYQRFLDRQSNKDSSRTKLVLCIDEYASLIQTAEKKLAEQCKQMVASMLMMSRSFNMHLILSLQRADAIYFATARDNVGMVIALGVLSKESRAMFFTDFENNIKPESRKRGTGYLLENGNFQAFVVPTVSDADKMKKLIMSALET